MIIRIDGEYSHIECDVKGCPERSPPADVMYKRHGLTGCGWFLDHRGAHRCPKHYDTPALAPGPQERSTRQQQHLNKKYGRA